MSGLYSLCGKLRRVAIVLIVISAGVSPGSSPRAGTAFFVCTVALAALFSFLVMLPSVLQRYDDRYPYQGIHILGPDAEVYYAARVREVYDGFPTLGNVFFSAPKDLPYLQPPLPEWTIATLGQVVGADAITAFLGSKVVLGFAVFLLFVAFLSVVTGLPWVALIATSSVMFGGALLSAPWDIAHFLQPLSYEFEFLRFSRAVNPQWSGTWFFAMLTGLASWIRFGDKRWLLLAAVGTVVLVYSYVYAWTYIVATVGLLTLWYLWHRSWRRASDLGVFWLIVAVFAAPYAMHMIATSNHPWYAASAMRLGLVASHGPVILGVWITVFIVISFLSKRLWSHAWPLLPALALGGFVALNQHVITGRYIVPHHYHWYFIQPLASGLAAAAVLTILFPLLSARGRQAFGVPLIFACIVVAAIQQWRSYDGIRALWGTMQQAAPVIRTVTTTMRPGHVVYTRNVHIANIIPVYTSADVYFAGNAAHSLVPHERARDTYFFDLWLEGFPPEQAEEAFLGVKRWTLSSRLHSIYYREAAGDFAAIPESEALNAAREYRAFMHLPRKDKLTNYPLTAVVTTPEDSLNPVWQQFLACSRETFSANGYALRLMIPAGERGSCL